MKSKKPSLTQNSLPVHLSSACTEAKLYSFIFEDLGSKNTSNHKTIKAEKPIQLFRKLEDLDLFLEKNPDLLELEHAGFAGYLGYDGQCELAIYETINISYTSAESFTAADLDSSDFFELIRPDYTEYIKAVKKCQEYIKEGDIYQANIAQKFRITGSRLQENNFGQLLYRKLKSINPAPYAGYMNFKDYEIISSSPESFLKILPTEEGWKISSSPIKGTAKLNELNQLIQSEKERAEHIMIVDLIRNDLGKICKTGSINTSELMAIHKFKNLYHYISTIEGILKPQNYNIPNFSQIFHASFPGGSISGVPKKRCLELIKQLENSSRGLFTGSMGYFKFKSGGEFNILIRSIIHDKNLCEWSFHAGSGITAYSDPEKELSETILKAEKLAESFGIQLQ